MYRALKLLVIVVFSCLLSVHAVADSDKRTPLEAFRGTAQFQLLMCQAQAKIAFLQVELGEISSVYSEINDCRKEGRLELKKLYPRASAMVSKKPAALKLLKDYYAASLAALDGVSPDISELSIAYEKRQGDAARKADELWSRFEIEAGL